MKLLISRLVFVFGAVILSFLMACSSVMDMDKINYKSEITEKPIPLDVPPDLTQLNRDNKIGRAHV